MPRIEPPEAAVPDLLHPKATRRINGEQTKLAIDLALGKCELKPGHYKVSSGATYLKTGIETEIPENRTRALNSGEKVLLEAMVRPELMSARISGKPVRNLEVRCTDPLPPRYELNFRVPVGLTVHNELGIFRTVGQIAQRTEGPFAERAAN